MGERAANAGERVRRRGRPRASDVQITEEQVLDAALEAFAEKGYDGMSVRDLNKVLGVSHNLVHRRFGSKADLWEATIDRAFGQFVDDMHPVLDTIAPGQPLTAFREFIVAFIETSARRPALWRAMMLEGSTEGPRLDYVWERHVRPFGRRMRAVLATLEGNERYTRLPQSTLFFLLAHGATAGPSHRPTALRLDHADPTDPAVLRQHANVVADLLLGVDPLERLDAAVPPRARRRRPSSTTAAATTTTTAPTAPTARSSTRNSRR